MSDKQRKRQHKATTPKWPIVGVTYFPPRDIHSSMVILKEPAVYNGMCNIRGYKITVEPIDEPVEELQQRLRYYWDNRRQLGITHPSNIDAMEKEAKKLGVELR